MQLEVYTFEKLTGETCKLTMHVIYDSVAKEISTQTAFCAGHQHGASTAGGNNASGKQKLMKRK